MSDNLPERLQASRVWLGFKRPYLGALLWALRPTPVQGLGTFGINPKLQLVYDPDKLQEWSIEHCATVLYHECGHILRDHAGRAAMVADRDPKAWNIAGDAEINDDLASEQCKWPFVPIYPKNLTPPQPAGLTAEEYYAHMPLVTVGMASDGDGKGNQKFPGQGKCQGVHPSDDDSKGDGVHPIEVELIRRQVAQDVQDMVKSRGTVPAWMQLWAQHLLEPKVDWRRMLRAEVRRAASDVMGQVDFRYKRPSRRTVVLPDLILPILRMPEIQIAVVVDTSGSMLGGPDNVSDLERAMAELSGVIKHFGRHSGVQVYAVDAAVASAKRVFKLSQISLAGGGGTNMCVGIEAAVNGKPKPNIVIVLTDGATPWPTTPISNVRVIAGVIGNERVHSAVPTWIRVVPIATQDEERKR